MPSTVASVCDLLIRNQLLSGEEVAALKNAVEGGRTGRGCRGHVPHLAGDQGLRDRRAE